MRDENIILRCIQEEDIERCAVLFTQVFSSHPWSEPWNNNFAKERLLHFYKSTGFVGVLAEQDDFLGFALGNTEPFYSGPIFYLREMCVQAELHNRGVGHQLLQFLQKKLSEQKVGGMYITTQKNIPAASFYQKNGFSYSEDMGFYAKSLS